MAFTSVKTCNFRNIKESYLHLGHSEVFFIGENGQGKSNILEALYLLCYGSSFRTSNTGDILLHGQKEMSLHGEYTHNEYSGNQQETGKVSLRIKGSEKKILLNEKTIRDRKELISCNPAIVFTHQDIEFIQGPPERKRWFFNQTMALQDAMFLDHLQNYQKILRLRNSSLKEHAYTLLPAYDIQLSQSGIDLQKKREKTVTGFNKVFTPLFRDVSGIAGALEIRYQPSWKECDSPDKAAHILKKKREQDMAMSTTTTGPHRDRFQFILDNMDFSKSASTGQMRLISLALRTAQAVYFSESRGNKPILLLDDVLLELDGKKREKFLSLLPEYEQAFFTFLPDEKYHTYRKADTRIYRVSKGEFFPE